MPVNECIEFYPSGRLVTCRATAAVTGKRFLKVTGPRVGGLIAVAPCTAGAKNMGVARNDVASGENVGTYGVGFIVPVTCGAIVADGIEVESDATGRAIPLATGRPCGYAVQGAASGADAQIRLY